MERDQPTGGEHTAPAPESKSAQPGRRGRGSPPRTNAAGGGPNSGTAKTRAALPAKARPKIYARGPRLIRMNESLAELVPEGEGSSDDAFFVMVAEGASFGKIADELGVSRATIYDWLNEDGQAEVREARLQTAREWAAGYHAEEGLATLDAVSADASTAEVSLAGHKARYRQWLAEVMNRRLFGRGPMVAIQNNVTGGAVDPTAFLQALREEGNKNYDPAVAQLHHGQPGPTVEAEVVEVDDED